VPFFTGVKTKQKNSTANKQQPDNSLTKLIGGPTAVNNRGAVYYSSFYDGATRSNNSDTSTPDPHTPTHTH